MKNLKFIYLIVFGSMIMWATFAYFTTTEIIQSQSKYAHLINISGKQRMLSQKSVLASIRYYEEPSAQRKAELIKLYNIMKNDHKHLVQSHSHSKFIDGIYFQQPHSLNAKVVSYLKLLSQFIHSPEAPLLSKIESSAYALLPILNKAVYAYESESEKKTNALMDRELIILLGTFFTLFIEALFIVFPIMKIATKHEDRLQLLVKQRTKELEELSITDQLTGLYNRREIDRRLNSELENAARYQRSFSLIMVDIDFFKNVNDTYGHQVGDDVLQHVALLLSTNIRKTDTLGRWGGEEFIIINTEHDSQKVLKFIEKLRGIIESYDFNKVGQVTCSFGIAHYTKGDTAVSILQRADRALYLAKDSGRNCVREYVKQ